MNKTKKKTHRITVTLDDATYEQVKNMAHRENRSMSEVLRIAAIETLTVQINAENIDMITSIIRQQLRDVMQPQVERLAALSAKTCVQSATAAYLTAETISRFVPVSQQEDLQEVYTAARKKAVEYTRRKTSVNDNEI